MCTQCTPHLNYPRRSKKKGEWEALHEKVPRCSSRSLVQFSYYCQHNYTDTYNTHEAHYAALPGIFPSIALRSPRSGFSVVPRASIGFESPIDSQLVDVTSRRGAVSSRTTPVVAIDYSTVDLSCWPRHARCEEGALAVASDACQGTQQGEEPAQVEFGRYFCVKRRVRSRVQHGVWDGPNGQFPNVKLLIIVSILLLRPSTR